MNDGVDKRLTYPEHSGKRRLRVLALKRADRTDGLFVQFRHAMPRATVAAPMLNAVGHILGSCRPAEMTGVYAPLMALAARMGRLMAWGWRWPMH